MKRLFALFLILLLALTGCKPSDEADAPIGTEDGGGSGYGVSAAGALHLEDFYFLSRKSTKEHIEQTLGSAVYMLGESEIYSLADDSKVILTYSETGYITEALYTSSEDQKTYGLFDILVSKGVLRDSGEDTPTTGEESQNGGENTPISPEKMPVFAKKTHKKEDFDKNLTLYMERSAVLGAFGAPIAFSARSYRKDSYIIDVYQLDDGSTLLLDYGYDRSSLRAASLKGTNGMSTTYLGSWTLQSRPADFVRPTTQLAFVTALKKGITPEKVYNTLGEPAWFEGSEKSHRDAYALPGGEVIYLSYNAERTKLESAARLTAEGKLLEVALG